MLLGLGFTVSDLGVAFGIGLGGIVCHIYHQELVLKASTEVLRQLAKKPDTESRPEIVSAEPI